MDNCTTCANAVFDELWGEYKCLAYQYRIYKPLSQTDCEFYKKKPVPKTKEDVKNDE